MRLVLGTLLIIFASNLTSQNLSKPRIVPFFDRIDDGPVFFVECRNDTGKAVESAITLWIRSLRVDGKIVPESGYALGPGLTTDIAPGGVWRGIIAFRQSPKSFFPSPKFGALARTVRVLPLSEGQHTIAVQCTELWSDEFDFFGESETHP